MKSYFRRIVAELGELDVLTHTLPYQARIVGRRSARHC
ncbi:MAG: hypothetical protein QOF52_1743 [Propionibacteriaceae bacterium]|jgi:hypothetical protein|nr:hypothetical protein [Propionibacteriaceae bacterium]MDX6321885.1 hypothetical protein [Propionibacteriaceae bacterium]